MDSLKNFVCIKVKMPKLNKLQTEKPLVTHLSTRNSVTPVEITHNLFVKRDSNQEYSENNRTVFVVNLPTDSTPKHIEMLFKSCGIIEDLSIVGTESGGCCHLTFEDEESVDLVLNAKKLNWPVLPSVMDRILCN